MKVRLDTDIEGLDAVLGPLEIRILYAIWNDSRAYMTNRQILRAVNHDGKHYLSLTTITTSTKRMVKKRLLAESTPHAIYVYSAAITENDLIDCIIERVMAALITSWPEHLETYLENITRSVKEVGGLYNGLR